MINQELIRNLAIIAHVDHGKTTLVDQMLKQSGIFHERQVVAERVLDRNDLERERGITIMAKNAAVFYGDYKFNIVDTPGHADFGGEVERIVQMVDGVLLLVDAVEGPMPQTRFVLKKALAAGLAPIVVVNKMDRLNARPEEVLDEVLDLFIELDANEKQLDFPVVYTDARLGTASVDFETKGIDLKPLFETIVKEIPAPTGVATAPLQLGITLIDYDPFLGRQAIGRIHQGTIQVKEEVMVIDQSGAGGRGRFNGLCVFEGLKKVPVEEASAGEIVVLSGVDNINVANTVTDIDNPVSLSFISIDDPTVSIGVKVNKSPLAGREGQYVTSRKLLERFHRELESDVSLKMETTDSPDTFLLFGRGELHLGILIEKLRREGYEFEVSRPKVIERTIEGIRSEPVEELLIEVPDAFVGVIMEHLGRRKAEMVNMQPKENGQVILVFRIPTRGLFGFRSEFLTATKGLGIMSHTFFSYEPYAGELQTRSRGSLVAFETGETTSYGLENAQERGELFVGAGTSVYRGMVVGEHSRPGDLVINVCKKKQLTNVRSATSDISIKLIPPRHMGLEQCLDFIADDELLEVTPKSLRMRKIQI